MIKGIGWRSLLSLTPALFSTFLLFSSTARAQCEASPLPAAAADSLTPSTALAAARLIPFHGRARNAEGEAMSGVVGVTFAIYAEQEGGAPLWQETQNVTASADGSFRALLGAADARGLPVDLFRGGESRWLAVLPHSPGVGEQARVLLISVPYALEAANAETLDGLPASAFARVGSAPAATAPLSVSVPSLEPVGTALPKSRAAITATGAKSGYLPIFSDAAGDLGSSQLYSSGSYLGVGTSTPAFNVDVVSQTDPAALTVEGFGAVGVNFIGRRARGTLAAPSALLALDNILVLQGRGYGSTGYSAASRAFIKFFAAENWSDTAQGTYISFATTPKGTNPGGNSAPEKMRLTDAGYLGVGTTAPDQMLTVAGAIHSTSGGFVFPDGSTMTSASSLGVGSNGSLTLAAGNSASTTGNVDLQTGGATTSTMSDRLLIAGKAKAMTGVVPQANLFSVHLAAGDAAGGRVKFTIVASDGSNYALETGEIVYLATPSQMNCAVVSSKYATTPPAYTNTSYAIPGLGQTGSLTAQCMPATFGGDPGLLIFDTAPTSFTATTHKVYYTIENQSDAPITLVP